MSTSATAINEALYDQFWRSCPDFSRYNPGVLHRRDAIRRLLGTIKFRSVLDVGCGDGQLLIWLKRQLGDDVVFTGSDLSSETVRENSLRHPYAQFHVMNLEREHLPGTYDVVLCTEVIEHLDEPAAALRNLAAMVAPGGHLILTCPTGKMYETERHFGHIAHPTPEEARGMIEGASLEVASLENWGWPLYSGLKIVTNIRPKWAIRNFANTRYGSAAKMLSKALYWLNYLNVPSSRFGCQLYILARKPESVR